MNDTANPTSWRTPPAAVAEEAITETFEADVAIVGFGYAGLAATRALAEAGCSVLAVESMPREKWWTIGHDLGHINSRIQKEFGVPEVDPIEFVNNFQLQSQNKSNPYFIMQFAKHSGETVDWFLEPVSEDIRRAARITHFPENEYTVRQLNNGYRYYPGTLQWWSDSRKNLEVINNGRGCELKNLSWANRDYLEANYPQARVLYGTSACYLEKDGDRVIGFIARTAEDAYIRVLGKKGVILCGGGFAANEEMCHELLSHVVRTLTPSEKMFGKLGRNGSAIQMGVWAGGRLETDISSMNYDSMATPDYIPGALWVDERGERFQNEAFGGTEINGFLMARMKRGRIIALYDSTYPTQILRGYPGHQAFDYSDPLAVRKLTEKFESARDAGPAGTRFGFYCADTLEELADDLGYQGEDKERFLHTITRYNALCQTGADWDFGKDPRFMNGLLQGPFFAHVTRPTLGFALVTTGGFVTTNQQQVVDENYQPIPGLYASGNTCGMRFGSAYITPMPGLSIGLALTLGRELGQYLANK